MRNIAIGLVLVVLIVLIVQLAVRTVDSRKRFLPRDIALVSIVEDLINSDVPGARFLEASWSPSTATVNYAYQDLYDVEIVYEKNSSMKKMSAVIGWSGKVWITPNRLDLSKLDRSAILLEGDAP
jgi:hypothetical protein